MEFNKIVKANKDKEALECQILDLVELFFKENDDITDYYLEISVTARMENFRRGTPKVYLKSKIE